MGELAEGIKEQAKDEATRRWDEAAERLKLATEYAHACLKGLFLANGGAIVALLAFLGNAKAPHFGRHEIWWAFGCFTVGLSLVLAAYIMGYISHASSMQAIFAWHKNALRLTQGFPGDADGTSHNTRANLAENCGIVCVALSLVLFVVGAFVALDALT